MRQHTPIIVVLLFASCGGASVVRYPHHKLDSDNPYLQAALRDMGPFLRSAFEHYLETDEVPSELTYDELGDLTVAAGDAADAVIGERDMNLLKRPDEFNVAAALTRFQRAISRREGVLRPDLEPGKINEWVDALPPDATVEEQERLYRKIVLGKED